MMLRLEATATPLVAGASSPSGVRLRPFLHTLQTHTSAVRPNDAVSCLIRFVGRSISKKGKRDDLFKTLFRFVCFVTCLTSSLAGQEGTMQQRVDTYAKVTLTTDVSKLTTAEKQMVTLLIEAAEQMDGVFWQEAYGDKGTLLQGINDAATRRFVEINYGPWDRLNENESFVPGVGTKPQGANFYPHDMTTEVFESYLAQHPDQADALKSLYTVVRRADGGQLKAIPYHQNFAAEHKAVAAKLRAAAELAEQASLKKYLLARADALESDEYQASDLAWLDMKDNRIDVVIGPIETYEDQLFGYKAAHEAYVLVKDMEWSQRLSKYAALLPELQKQLPVDEQYRTEEPGSNSDLNAYDVIYYAGDCNAGSKTIAINLPNDEEVQLQKGYPPTAAEERHAREIRQNHGADCRRTHRSRSATTRHLQRVFLEYHVSRGSARTGHQIHRRGKPTCPRCAPQSRFFYRRRLKQTCWACSWSTNFGNGGEITEGDLEDYYVTFIAGIFRSVRFGATSAHGKANMVRFNYFADRQAFTRETNGRYRVHLPAMREAMRALSGELLTLQGDGDFENTGNFIDTWGEIGPALAADLQRLNQKGIPVDVVFKQGKDVLGL